QTAWSVGSVVEVFSCTVSVALCEALPHVPVVVTLTVWLPTLSEPVGTLMLEVLPPNGEPSRVQEYVNGPVPPAVVENDAEAPWQTVWSVGSEDEVFAGTVSVVLCEALPHVP